MISLLLPTPGDPVILGTWFKNLKKFDHLFDEILILVNHLNVGNSMNEFPINKKLIEKLENFCYNYSSDKIKILFNHHLNQHGFALNELIDKSKNDCVMFIEDDHYILDIKGLKEHIELVTSGKKKVVGLGRGSCTNEIYDKYAKDYPNRLKSANLQGPGFWPSYFIFNKNLYYKTDCNLGSKTFNKSDGYECKTEQSADTMVWFSIQLHKLLKDEDIFFYSGNYHGRMSDILIDDELIPHNKDLPEIKDVTDFHFGSLSSLFGLRLFENHDLFKKLNHTNDFIPQKVNQSDKEYFLTCLEILRRIIWIKIMNNNLDSSFKKNYSDNINFLLDIMNNNNQFNKVNLNRLELLYERAFL